MKERISKSVIVVVLVGLTFGGFILRRLLTRQELTNSAESTVNREEGGTAVSNDVSMHQPTAGSKQATILPDVVPLPLRTIVTGEENGMWMAEKEFQLLPQGTQSFGGMEFHCEGLLQMQGIQSEAIRLKYRNRVLLPLAQAGVTNARIGSLHLVGATRFLSELGAEVAEVVWRYSDGTKERAQLFYNEHVRDWNHVPYEEPARLPYSFSKAIWRAEKPDPAGRWLRIYRVSVANPQLEKAVRQIELTSGRGGASLFVLAATLDPLEPGARPDDSLDLEPVDAIPPRYIDVVVTSSDGQAVPKANIRLQWRVKNERGIAGTRQMSADNAGAMRIKYPSENLSKLEITASHENFASRKMAWSLVSGDVVPESYQIKLIAGVSIGGFIVDSSDGPVPDAKLSFQSFSMGGEDLNRKGEQSEFSTRTIMSDSQGVWKMKNLPADLLANISLNVEHPDFLPANLASGRSAGEEKKLREGSFKIVLSRTVEIGGFVVDENSNPIADASVSTGRRNFPDRHQRNTDSAGHFVFQGIVEGDTLFSAMAKGRKPISKTVRVRAGMDAVTLRLEVGSVIKGIVQNSAGEPISDVHISLQNYSPNEPGYEFSTTTGIDGRFMWDGAPDERLNFNFSKNGYAQKGGVWLKANENNVIILHKPREVQGVVLDADSGQPVTKFQVAAGRSYDPFYADYSGKRDFADANGQFTFLVDDEQNSGIQIHANDYADLVKDLPKEQEGAVKMEFRLKPSPALHGTVVGQDGSPVPGAQVALTREGFGGPANIHWRGGRFENYGNGAQIVATDSSGEFTLNSPPESDGLIVAVGEIGFGSSTVERVRNSGIVMLLPYGQIEGVLKIAGQPASGKEILFSLQNVGVMTDFQKFKVETDDEGKFKFEKLPAGEGQLVRLVKTSASSWMHSQSTSVKVESGQTTFVTLGDSGAVIRGRARLDSPPEEGEALTISGSLHTVIDRANFASTSDAQAFYRSAEWRAQTKLQKHFAVLVNPDGSFVVDSVPPGSYSLTLNAAPAESPFGFHQGMPTMSKPLSVTVSDNPDPMSPIDVGEIVLTKPPTAK